ncbi:MAG: biopolymer transporter ExbD [bacterium]|nr:biopolymer transporter ExbD [bacterium]
MAFKPSRKKKRMVGDYEINLMPFMDLCCVLVTVLLASSRFVEVALLEYATPTVYESGTQGGGSGMGGGEVNALLELRCNVTYDALEMSVFNATSGENYTSFPKMPDGNFDWEALRSKLVDIKTRIVGPPISTSKGVNASTRQVELSEKYKYADGDQVRISAVGDIPLQTLVRLMDTCREYQDERGVFHPLFPSPALGQIQ